MKKTKDTNKGITLIALVITIIVMLILVAVTITMAVNGGLFDYASSAGRKTNTATADEQEYANLQPDMTVNQLIDKYTGWTGEGSQGGTGDDTTPCTKCTNGVVEGYKCGNADCNEVSSGYSEEWYEAKCSKCGYTFRAQSTDRDSCGSCKEEFVIKYNRLYDYECGHSSTATPVKSNYPCPECSI